MCCVTSWETVHGLFAGSLATRTSTKKKEEAVTSGEYIRHFSPHHSLGTSRCRCVWYKAVYWSCACVRFCLYHNVCARVSFVVAIKKWYFMILTSALARWDCVWCSSVPRLCLPPTLWRPLHEVCVVFNLVSFQMWRVEGGARGQRGGCCVPGMLDEIGLPLPIIVNIIPPDRRAGRAERGMRGAFAGRDPLKHIH